MMCNDCWYTSLTDEYDDSFTVTFTVNGDEEELWCRLYSRYVNANQECLDTVPIR